MILQNSYLSGKIPNPLKEDELTNLFEKYYSGDRSARNKIIEHNIKLVFNEVFKKFQYANYEQQELVSIGIYGLIKAVDSFNTKKGIKFSSYAIRCIDNEILMFFRKTKNISLEESFEGIISTDKNGDNLKLIDVLVDDNSNVQEEIEKKESLTEIKQLVDLLEGREKKIIELYFGFNGYEQHSQQEIADMFGVSRSYICRIINKTLQKLKNKILDKNNINTNVKSNKSNVSIKKPRRNKNNNINVQEQTKNSPSLNNYINSTNCFTVLNKLDSQEEVITILKLGLVNHKTFSDETIMKFLNIEKIEISNTMNKILLFKQK